MSRRTIFLVLLILFLSVVLQINFPIDEDVAFYIQYVKRIWFGQDSLSNSEPFYFWLMQPFPRLLYVIPAIISILTPLTEEVAAKLYINLIAGLSLGYLVSFVRRYRAVKGIDLEYLIPVFAFFVFLFPAVESFGQRENIFYLLFFPYVLSVISRLQDLDWNPGLSPWLAATIVPALLIKPFFVIPWLALECFAVLATRNPAIAFNRLNGIIIGANGVFYVLLFSAIVTVGWEQFFEMAQIRYVYTKWSPLSVMFFRKLSLLWVLAGVGFAAYRWALGKRSGKTGAGSWGGPDVLFVAFLAAMVVVIIQHKGSDYHWYPAVVFSGMGLAWSFGELSQLKEKTKMPRLKASVVGLGLLCALFAAATTYRTVNYARIHWEDRKALTELAATLTEAADGGAFFAIDGDATHPIFQLVLETGLFHAHRYYNLWYLDGAYPAEGEEGTEEGKRRIDTLVNIFLEDFERWKPKALIWANAPKSIDRLLSDPRLRPIFDRYEPFRKIGPATYYRLPPEP